MNMNLTSLSLLLLQLRWKQMTIVTDDQKDAKSLIHMSETKGLQQALVSGREALSGEWVYNVVKMGRDSWSPVYIYMMCSATCMNAALRQATLREREFGIQTAFGMTSRWLLMSTGSGRLIDHLVVVNTTMDNVAVVDTCLSTQRCYRNLVIHTLQWKKGHTRQWTLAGRWSQEQFHYMAYSETADWDQLLFPNSRLGFNGRRIRVLVKEWESYLKVTIKNGTKLWSGVLMDFLNVARDHLNFTYDLVHAMDMEWGSLTPGAHDRGFVQYVARKEVDIGLSSYDATWHRFEVLDGIWPLIYTPMCIVYQKPEVTDTFRMPLGPLSSALIVGLVSAWAAVISLLWVLEIASTAEASVVGCRGGFWRIEDCRMLQSLDKVVMISGAAMLSEPSETKLRSRGGRTLLRSWWMLLLVVTAAYSGTLTSFLSVSKRVELFSTPEDLLTKDHHYTWGSFSDTTFILVIQNSTSPLYQGLWSGIERFLATDPTVLSDNTSVLAKKVRSEDFVLFVTRLTAISMFGEDCNIIIKDAGIKTYMAGPILPAKSALVRPLSDLVHRLYAEGVVSQWIDKWFTRTSCPSDQGPVIISLLHVKGVLLVLPVGLGLAVLVIMLEIAYFRKRKTNQQYNLADKITQ